MFAPFLLGTGRILFWWIAAGILLVVPWLFGGMSRLAYDWIFWSGLLCLWPLGVWLATSRRLHPGPTRGFWIALVCWSLLAVQVWWSQGNRSHDMLPPWSRSYLAFTPIDHTEWLPSSAYPSATRRMGLLYLSFALLALTGYTLGMRRRPFQILLALLALNVVVLSLVGIPFKYSGERKILGEWEFSEWYFYATFYYHNHWAAYALLGLGALMTLWLRASGRVSRTVLLFGVVVVLVSLVVAKTRLGLLAALGLTGWFLWCRVRPTLSQRGRSWAAPALGLAVVLAGCLGGVAWWQSRQPEATEGRQWESLLAQNPFTTRLQLLSDAGPMLGNKPLFGWGIASFGPAFQQFQRRDSIQLHNGIETRYDHPHNDWLECLGELGLVGAGLLLAPGWSWLRSARRRGIASSSRAPLLAAAIALLVFALGDMAFVNRAVCAGFGLLCGLAFSPHTGESAATSSRPTPVPAPTRDNSRRSRLRAPDPKDRPLSRAKTP